MGASPLRALCEKLAPGDRALAAAVALAQRDPEAALAAHAERLLERGIAKPRRDFAWIVLVERLLAGGLLAEVDWKEAPEEVMASLDRVIARRALPAPDWGWYDVDAFAERALATFLKAAGGAIAASGCALVELDIGADAHPLTVVKVGVAALIIRAATAAGFKARVWKGPVPKPAKPAGGDAPEELALPLAGSNPELRIGDTLVLASPFGASPHAVWLDATHWPPVIRDDQNPTGWVARSRGGRWAVVREGAIEVGTALDALTAVPCEVEARYVTFVGERLVVFPRANASAPLLETAGGLHEAPGLPASGAGQQGGVRVGDEDLVVHGGRVWRLAENRFVSASDAVIGEGRLYWDAVGDDDGFYYYASTRTTGRLLRVALSGAAKPVKVGIAVHEWSVARPGPAGSLLLVFHQPVAGNFAALLFPAHGIAVPLPRKLLGKYTPGSGTFWLEAAQRLLVVLWSSAIAIPIATLRALPQRAMTTGKPIPKSKRLAW